MLDKLQVEADKLQKQRRSPSEVRGTLEASLTSGQLHPLLARPAKHVGCHLDLDLEVPVLAVHNQLDEWIDVTGQRTFIDTLRKRYADPNNVVFHVYEEPTGAPFEHAGFGRFSADSKIRQLTFLQNAFGIHT